MSDTTTCAEPNPILLYLIGRRDRPVVALEAMDKIRLRGHRVSNWIAMEELYIQGSLTKSALMNAIKQALDESAGGILLDPARQNGCAEAAYLAGQGKPVVAVLTEGNPTAKVEVLHRLIDNWSADSVDRALDFLAELIRGEKRPGQ